MAFVKLMKSTKVLELLKNRPTAYDLLTLIAFRAKRNTEEMNELEIGQAYIGDYESYGVTEMIYRLDKKFLEKYKIITTKTTNKGTIASLLDNSIFDINGVVPITTKITDEQRPNNDPITTNKKVKEVKRINLSKDKLANASYGNELVEKVLSLYEKHTGNLPADKYPRRIAHNIAQITTTLIKDIRPHYNGARIGELTPELILEKAFDWYFGQLKDDVEVTKLDTVKQNIRARFYEASRKKYIPNYKFIAKP